MPPIDHALADALARHAETALEALDAGEHDVARAHLREIHDFTWPDAHPTPAGRVFGHASVMLRREREVRRG